MEGLQLHAHSAVLMQYHIGEELLIALICCAIAFRAWRAAHSAAPAADTEKRDRVFLVAAGFVLLGFSSLIHAGIHAFHFSPNLLYQTLLGYCLGLLTLIAALSAERPITKRPLPLLYIPLLVLLVPQIYQHFPLFGEFRPLVWISVAYFSGVVCLLYVAIYYRTKSSRLLFSAFGHALICTSAVFLFFPAAIGSPIWLYGHLFRPAGFLVLLFSMSRRELSQLHGSILYKALTAFSLLAAIPLLIFSSVLFYENIATIDIIHQRLLLFLLLLVTFAAALVFGLGMIIRLIRPILFLRESVDRLFERGFDRQVEIHTNDEIGELAGSFNTMIKRLGYAIDEQERLCRMAATGELAATLAHEIKNPLNAIDGAAAYIRKNYQGSLIQEFINIISDEVGRINKLTTNLLHFASPAKPDMARNDINEIVRETVVLLEQESREQDIAVETILAAHLPKVECDSNQIKQVLINLLINAFDAIEEHGKVTVTSGLDRDDIFLMVQDTGKGIKEDEIKKIFNPFYTTKTRGTGLGLAISRKIALEHGGDLKVKSAAEKGSTFTLTISQRNRADDA